MTYATSIDPGQPALSYQGLRCSVIELHILLATSVDTDKTVRIYRLIWVYASPICHKVGVYPEMLKYGAGKF